MSYEKVYLNKKINCSKCKKEIEYYINYRTFNNKLTREMPIYLFKILRDEMIYSEKLVCGCKLSVEYFRNIIPTWRIVDFEKIDKQRLQKTIKATGVEKNLAYVIKAAKDVLRS